MTQEGTAPKPVRAVLRALWREFKHCREAYGPLYHDRFVFSNTTSEMHRHGVEAVCRSFRAAHEDDFGDDWDEWYGDLDVAEFNRFFGSGDGLGEFQLLAETACLTLAEVSERVPGYGYEGWIALLYQMAWGYPTPLLNCTMETWNERAITDPIEELEAIGTRPDGGAPYPRHPTHLQLLHNLYTSSMAAIELILDGDKALLIGEWRDDFPVSFPFNKEKEAPAVDSIVAKLDVAMPDESLTPPVLAFHYVDFFDRWYLKFKTKGGIEEGSFANEKGFSVFALLLRNPDKHMSPQEILYKTGQGDVPTPVEEAALKAASNPIEPADREAMKHYRKKLREAKDELAICENPEKVEELKSEIDWLEHETKAHRDFHGQPRKIASDPGQKAYTVLQGQIHRARLKISVKMAEFGRYLRCVGGESEQFIYRPR